MTSPLFLTENEAAEMLALNPSALRWFRRERRGPRWFRFGKFVRYQREDLLEWAAAQASDGDLDD